MQICRSCSKGIPDGSVFCNLCGARQNASVTARKRRRGNGQGTVVKEANGTYTAVRTQMCGDKRRTRKKRGFRTKKEAVAYLPSLTFAPVPEQERNITFEQLYDEWSRKHFEKLSDSKITAYKIAYKRCEPLHGQVWHTITLKQMQSVVDALPSYYTRRDVKNLLSQMGEYAMKNEYAEKNRGRLIDLPPLEKKEAEAFTVEEVNKLWGDYEKGKTFTGYALTMIYTGMRPGELMDVLLENIHLEDGYLTGGKKTEAGKTRPIVITDKIRPVVEKLSEGKRKKLVEIHPDKFRSEFDAMTVRAGVRPLKPYACRHTFCSMLALAGVQPGIIQKVVGHANYSTTAGYTHLQSLADGLAAVGKMVEFIAPERVENGKK